MNENNHPVVRFWTVLIAAIALLICAQFSLAQETNSAKITRLLKQNSYDYIAKADSVWTVNFTGKSLKSFKIVMASQDDLLVTFVIVAHKKDFDLSSDFMQKLLRFNHDLDRVKVGIDEDGDLFVRTDQSIRVLDEKEFKVTTEQVAASANDVFAGIASLLKQ